LYFARYHEPQRNQVALVLLERRAKAVRRLIVRFTAKAEIVSRQTGGV
jgi:hypothetical protein